MGNITDKLSYLNDTKKAIKNAIISKGVAIEDADTFRSYADKIGLISGGEASTEEWQPNPNWWDIKKILDEDTRDYVGKVGVILYDFNDVSKFKLSSVGIVAIATSDGAFYTYEGNGASVSHNWDISKDKDDGYGNKTRWIIYYYNKDSTTDNYATSTGPTENNTYGWGYNYIAYIVFRINCDVSQNFCGDNVLLEGVDNEGYVCRLRNAASFFYNCRSLKKIPNIDFGENKNFNMFFSNCLSLTKLPDNLDTSFGTSFSYFLNNCSALTKLPDNLDTSNGTDFSYFCQSCAALTKLPDGLDTSNGTNFSNFCYNCYTLAKLPDNLDTSNGTNFSNFLGRCYALAKLPDGLDTSNGTNFSNFLTDNENCFEANYLSFASNTTNHTSKYSGPFINCYRLKTINLTLPSNTNFWLDSSTRISIESFRYIADHTPDVTATPRTLTVGSTNISRINAEDPTIITDLNAKGWTVA